MKLPGKILVALVATVGAVVALDRFVTWLNDEPREFRSGAELADILIGATRLNDGVANVTGVCVLPGDGFVDIEARRLFSGADIQFIESNESDVAWYIAIRNKSSRLEIYEIRHEKLRWDWEADETKTISEIVTCPRKIVIEHREPQCPRCTGYVVAKFESWRGGASGP